MGFVGYLDDIFCYYFTLSQGEDSDVTNRVSDPFNGNLVSPSIPGQYFSNVFGCPSPILGLMSRKTDC